MTRTISPSRIGRRSFLLLTSLMILGTAAAQDPRQDADLKAQPPGQRQVWRHEKSKTTFTVPKDWELADGTPRQEVEMSVIHLRRGDLGVDVTVSWVPVLVRKRVSDPSATDREPDVEETIQEELRSLQLIYGKDKVVEAPAVVHPNNKSARAFRVLAGPRRNEKEEGYVLVFDSGPDANTRWKVQMRANFQKRGTGDDVSDRVARVTELFKQNFQW